MKLRTNLIHKLLCLSVLAFAVSAQAQNRTDNPSSGQWRRYELGKGAFSVLLPVEPKEDFRSTSTPDGLNVDMYSYGVATEHGIYAAQYGLLEPAAENWSEGARENYYSGVWKGVSTNLNSQMEKNNVSARAELVDKHRAKFGGFDGYELVFKLGGIKGRLLVTLVGRHSFMAMAMGPADMPDADKERFFNSFTIKIPSVSPTAR